MPNQFSKFPVITIDGSSGAGKGTLTARLAAALDYAMLDSGALYRIVGLMAHKAGLLQQVDNQCQSDDELAKKLGTLTESLDIRFMADKSRNHQADKQQTSEHIGVWVNGGNVTHAIRTEQVGEYASKVAVFGSVRDALLTLQKNMADPTHTQAKGLIADGRDMGTVVFPTATLKIYLVASAEARAQRRVSQLANAGKVVDTDEVLAQIIARDERDSSRSIAPAKPADDAIVIDSSSLSADDVYAQVWQLCQERGLTS